MFLKIPILKLRVIRYACTLQLEIVDNYSCIQYEQLIHNNYENVEDDVSY